MHGKELDYLVLVNADNILTDGFFDKIEMVTTKNSVGRKFLIEKKTWGGVDTAKTRTFRKR